VESPSWPGNECIVLQLAMRECEVLQLVFNIAPENIQGDPHNVKSGLQVELLWAQLNGKC